MAQTDPTGWILTGISVFVVFSALIILYFLYSASGALLSGKIKLPKPKKRAPKGSDDGAVAAAIAMALEAECGDCTPVAIATALHLHFSTAVHDVEPGIITISRGSSAWNNPQRNFRKNNK